MASKSMPRHAFALDSAFTGREKPKVKTASARRNEHFRYDRSGPSPVRFIAKPPDVSCILAGASAVDRAGVFGSKLLA